MRVSRFRLVVVSLCLSLVSLVALAAQVLADTPRPGFP